MNELYIARRPTTAARRLGHTDSDVPIHPRLNGQAIDYMLASIRDLA